MVPVASHIIATEELPQDLARSLIPKARTLSDTKQVLCYYRMSPDGTRMVFGGRARFTQVNATASAPILHRYMTDRFPRLRGSRSPMRGPATSPSPWMLCLIWGSTTASIIASAVTGAGSR